MPGRKPKPTALKVLQGTDQPCRINKNEMKPILYGWMLGGTHKFYGDRKQTTVWDIDRPTISKEHPTMKPVGLVEKALTNSSKKSHVAYDPFGGSGSTMIACEKLNRKCYMMEIDPAYCDVIVERYKSLFPENEVRSLN